MADQAKFWLVWSPQGDRSPSHRHSTAVAARREAERLASQHPGKSFFVVESVGFARKVDVAWTDTNETEIPF